MLSAIHCPAGDARIAERGHRPGRATPGSGRVGGPVGGRGPLARSSGKQSPGLFSDPPYSSKASSRTGCAGSNSSSPTTTAACAPPAFAVASGARTSGATTGARTDGARWLIVLGGATWQRCRSSGKQRPTLFSDPPHHLARNAIHHAPNAEIRKRIGRQLKSIWTADDLARAETALTELVASYRDTAPRLADWLEENVPEGLAVFTLPEHHRKRLRTSARSTRSSAPSSAFRQQELKRRTAKVSLRRENSAPRCFLILLSPRRGCPPAPRQRRAGRDRQKMGLRNEGLHQVGMPGCMTRSQQNFQTSGCSILCEGLRQAW